MSRSGSKRKPEKVWMYESYGFIVIRNTKPKTPKQFAKWFEGMMKRRMAALKALGVEVKCDR